MDQPPNFKQTQSMSDSPGDGLSLLCRFSECLKAADWSHTVDVERNFVLLMSTNDLCSFRVLILVKERAQHLIVIISVERRCPAAFRDTMADFCNLINYEIPFGFFSLDGRDGETRYRHSVDVEGIKLTPTFVDNLLKESIGHAKRSYTAIQRIMAGLSIEAAKKENG
jgi:hypothetical protein